MSLFGRDLRERLLVFPRRDLFGERREVGFLVAVFQIMERVSATGVTQYFVDVVSGERGASEAVSRGRFHAHNISV